jgi:hypothetical protein
VPALAGVILLARVELFNNGMESSGELVADAPDVGDVDDTDAEHTAELSLDLVADV